MVCAGVGLGMIELVAPEPADVASPCVGVCVIDEQGLCEGCARTLDEIAGWSAATFAERRVILAALPGRRGPTRNQPDKPAFP